VAEVRLAAELHDVGKVAIPEVILDKPGPLDETEWAFMRRHTLIGERIVAAAPALGAVARLVRASHERWDGRGYPDAVAGEDIPLGARIFAAVDTYDAITSDRPYRKARPHAVAIAELQRVSGQQLDPRIVEAFQEIPEVELKRLRALCRRVHPGLRLPADLLDRLSDSREMPIAHAP
jgi:HD-GYP domain-containing protein (c-di-GMP phosphodiesterase class II)